MPENLGGAGLDPVSTAIALGALGYGCLWWAGFAICAHLLAWTCPIWKHGTADQHARYLPDLCNGAKIAVNGMTEPGTGSDAFNMQTRAVPQGTSGFVVNGAKTFLVFGAPITIMRSSDFGACGAISLSKPLEVKHTRAPERSRM